MRLSWQPLDNEGESAGRPVVLADTFPARGPGSKICVSSAMGHSRAVEAVQYPRSQSTTFFDRKNQSTTVQAVVAYEFRTVRECCQFIAELGESLGGRGNLTMSYPEGGSNTIPGCVWSAIPVQPKIGVTAIVNYTFTGGAVDSE